jgi:hypothetical protein
MNGAILADVEALDRRAVAEVDAAPARLLA